MSRRNNTRRRRSYGRRQHELRQRPTVRDVDAGSWPLDADELYLHGVDGGTPDGEQRWRRQ